MNKTDRVAGIIVLLGAGGMLTEALQLDLTTDIGPGPGFFPVGLGMIMAVLALSLIASSYMRKDARESEIPPRAVLIKIGMIFSALIGFLILTPLLGFLIGGALFLFVVLSFVETMRFSRALPLAVLIALGFYLIFSVGLGVKLPVGPAGI